MGVIITVSHKSRPPVTDILGFFTMKMSNRQGGWKQHGVVIIARFVLTCYKHMTIWHGRHQKCKMLNIPQYQKKMLKEKRLVGIAVLWHTWLTDHNISHRSFKPTYLKSLDKVKADHYKIIPKCGFQCEIVDIRNPVTKADFITSDPLFQ